MAYQSVNEIILDHIGTHISLEKNLQNVAESHALTLKHGRATFVAYGKQLITGELMDFENHVAAHALVEFALRDADWEDVLGPFYDAALYAWNDVGLDIDDQRYDAANEGDFT